MTSEVVLSKTVRAADGLESLVAKRSGVIEGLSLEIGNLDQEVQELSSPPKSA